MDSCLEGETVTSEKTAGCAKIGKREDSYPKPRGSCKSKISENVRKNKAGLLLEKYEEGHQ